MEIKPTPDLNGSLDKPSRSDLLSHARALGLQGTDEQILAYTHFIELKERSAEAIRGRDAIWDCVHRMQSQTASALNHAKVAMRAVKRLQTDFYSTYEIVDDETPEANDAEQ